MEHFYNELQIKTFFNFANVYDKMIDAAPDNALFVEIGVWRGQSVCYAAVEILNKNKNIKIHAIDTWEGSTEQNLFAVDTTPIRKTLYDDFLENIEPVKHIITPVKLDSVSASKNYEDRSIDFVFIDGSHLYEDVKNDIDAWLPKVKIGGYLGGHDYNPDEKFSVNGVKTAVDEIFNKKIDLFNLPWGSWLHKKKN